MGLKKGNKETKFIIVIILLLLCIFMYINYQSGQGFSIKDFKSSIEKNEIKIINEFPKDFEQQTNYIPYEDRIIEYSGNGIKILNQNKEVQWETSLQLNEPIIKVKEKYFVVADKKKSIFYLYEGKEKIYEINIEVQIENIHLNKQGIVAVIGKKENNINTLHLFDKKGKEIITRIHELSSIMSIDLSSDGQYLAVALLKVDNTKLISEIVFLDIYNEKLEKYMNDNIISKQEYEGIITDIRFTKDNDLVAIGDTFMVVLDLKAKEKMKKEIKEKIIMEDIYNGGIGAFVTEGDFLSSYYNIHILNAENFQVTSNPLEIQEEPKGILVENNIIMVYTSRKIYVFSKEGQLKWSANIFMDIQQAYRADKDKYLVISREKGILISK